MENADNITSYKEISGIEHKAEATFGIEHKAEATSGIEHKAEATSGIEHNAEATSGIEHNAESSYMGDDRGDDRGDENINVEKLRRIAIYSADGRQSMLLAAYTDIYGVKRIILQDLDIPVREFNGYLNCINSH